MTDVSNLSTLAAKISSSSPAIRAYAIAQAAATVSQENDLRALLARVAALELAAAGAPPTVPTVTLGGELPKRIQAPTGASYEYTDSNALITSLQQAAPGTRHKLTVAVDRGGYDLLIRAKGTAAAPILVELPAPVRNGRVLVSQSSYVKVIGADFDGSPIDALKITDGSVGIDVDMRGGYFRNAKGQGFLQTDPTCRDWQVWNVRERGCGSNGNKDHGAYIAAARGACVLGNFDSNPWAYGVQVYPDSQDLIVTGATVTGTRSTTAARGGMILGIQDSTQNTSNVRVVASLVQFAAVEGIGLYSGAVDANGNVVKRVSGCSVRSCFGYGNAGGDWAAVAGALAVLRSGHAATGLVDPLDFGLVAPTNIDGKPRDPAAVMAGAA